MPTPKKIEDSSRLTRYCALPASIVLYPGKPWPIYKQVTNQLAEERAFLALCSHTVRNETATCKYHVSLPQS